MSDDLIISHSPDDLPITPENERFKNGRLPKRVGRPKGPDSVTEALKQQLGVNQNAARIAKNMIGIAQNTKRVNAAVVAAREIADRIDGKPVQGLIVGNVNLDEPTVRRLALLGEMFLVSKDVK